VLASHGLLDTLPTAEQREKTAALVAPLRGAAHGDCAVTDIPRQGGAAQSAGPTIPRATPYSAGKPATGVSAAPYTPRP